MIDNLCRHVMGFTHNHILHPVLMGGGKTILNSFPFSICASEVLNDESIVSRSQENYNNSTYLAELVR
jgi:hypothetical protein